MFGSGNLSGYPTFSRPLAGMGHFGDEGSYDTPQVFRPLMRPDGLGLCDVPTSTKNLLFRLFNAPAEPTPLTWDFVGFVAIIALVVGLFRLAFREV